MCVSVQQIQLVKTSLGRLGRDAKEVVRQKEEELREVNARCEIVLAWARRARDEFIEDLTSREQMALDGVQSEERSAGKVLDTLSSTVSQAGRPTLTDPDVVLLKNKLLAALLQDDALDHHRQLAARENHRVFFASRASQALELNEVRAFIGELFDPQGVCKDPSPAVSFSELVAKVACLTTQVPKLERESKAIENRVSSTLADVQDKATYLEMQMEKRTAEVTDIQKQLREYMYLCGSCFTKYDYDLIVRRHQSVHPSVEKQASRPMLAPKYFLHIRRTYVFFFLGGLFFFT